MIIAANFKTNHTRRSTKEYIDKLKEFAKKEQIEETLLVFPPSTALDSFELPPNLRIGAQNAYPINCGSFTGEIAHEQLEEFGIKTILIGHSERRIVLKESQEFIAKKYNFYKDAGFEIVYCIGEPKEVRVEGIEAVLEYLWRQFEDIDIDYEKLIVAYEPVWAIGTGLSASKEQIDETLSLLKQKIKAPLLYGGSVKVSNTKEVLSIPNCSGILVGTASWDIGNFCEMAKISKKLN